MVQKYTNLSSKSCYPDLIPNSPSQLTKKGVLGRGENYYIIMRAWELKASAAYDSLLLIQLRKELWDSSL